ncbi:hypothetical protein B0H63DRAFT_468246, partial [Podospora didyma]
MPLLYGEGTKAFVRLQEEIMKRIPDLSFLLWSTQQPKLFLRKNKLWAFYLGPISDNPKAFIDSFNTRPLMVEGGGDESHVTSLGLSLRLRVAGTLAPWLCFAFCSQDHKGFKPVSKLLNSSFSGFKSLRSVWIPLVSDSMRPQLKIRAPRWFRTSFPSTFVIWRLRTELAFRCDGKGKAGEALDPVES